MLGQVKFVLPLAPSFLFDGPTNFRLPGCEKKVRRIGKADDPEPLGKMIGSEGRVRGSRLDGAAALGLLPFGAADPRRLPQRRPYPVHLTTTASQLERTRGNPTVQAKQSRAGDACM